MLCQFPVIKVSTKMESLRKTGSKTSLLAILVSLMMIGTTTDLADVGVNYNKYDWTVTFFTSKCIYTNVLLVSSHGKIGLRNKNIMQKWLKYSIIDNTGVSGDDWDLHSSSRWRVNIVQGWKTCDCIQFRIRF